MITKGLENLNKASLKGLSKEAEYRRNEKFLNEEAKRGDLPAELVNESWNL